MNKIIVKDLEKNFDTLQIIDKISFMIVEGEFVSIVGPSGCGKTTLLHLIHQFIQPTKGIVKTIGKMGIVFQDHNLFPWRTVKDNVTIGLKIKADILKEVGLWDFKDHYPHQISEGMKQRVGIARCLVNKSDILLLDEPFASLDYFTRLKMHDFILDICKKRKLTTILVTHDIDEAIKLSDRIIVLSKRPARLKAIIYNDQSDIKEKILSLID